MVRCSVKNCEKRSDKDKNHHFFTSQNPITRKQWAEFAQYTGNAVGVVICSDHFEDHCYRKKSTIKPLLYSYAVPTLARFNIFPNEKIKREQVNKSIELKSFFEKERSHDANRNNQQSTSSGNETNKEIKSEKVIIKTENISEDYDIFEYEEQYNIKEEFNKHLSTTHSLGFEEKVIKEEICNK